MGTKVQLPSNSVLDCLQILKLEHAEGKMDTNTTLKMDAKNIIRHQRNVHEFATDQVIVKQNVCKIQLVIGNHTIGQTFKAVSQRRLLLKSVYRLN